ncbi:MULTISPECIES: hypothetical protein [unclassified Sporolactobacillus]|uniref:hypothetical protein n=1 Tax=unclassified Sporolactobacillus TaxID=2628533 RepID=UPI002368AA8B|nr:hypothetical protein [Sporolactobacillus sp. CQH2019]MDD9148571.1 hypothetical protein [Sporolactobacillus sp. CQH2019]
MKKIDWFFSLLLIIMGLTCLLFSANAFGHENLLSFGKTLVRVCMWLACPVLLFVGFYIWFHFRKKR